MKKRKRRSKPANVEYVPVIKAARRVAGEIEPDGTPVSRAPRPLGKGPSRKQVIELADELARSAVARERSK